jgi:hypothetical protein
MADIWLSLTWELALDFPPEWTPAMRCACAASAA